MTPKPRRGSWRQVAPGTYTKNIGTYGSVKFGATARVSFVPFPTCEIIDATGAHAAIPTPVDQKKYIAAAKKVYVKDTKAAAERASTREYRRAHPAPPGPKGPEKPVYSAPYEGHRGRHLVHRPSTAPGIHGSIRALTADIAQYETMITMNPENASAYRSRIKSLQYRIKKLRE